MNYELFKTNPIKPNMLYELTYDELGRKEQVDINDLDNSTLATYKYYYMRTAAIEQVWDGASYDTTNIAWTYDALNRLEVEDYNSPDAPNDFEHTYVYNLVGNRLEKQVTDGIRFGYELFLKVICQETSRDSGLFMVMRTSGPDCFISIVTPAFWSAVETVAESTVQKPFSVGAKMRSS